MFASVLVANRGEIAVRVLRTCRELGIRGIAVYSDADADALHVAVADEAVHLPGTSAAQTYLDIDLLVRTALDSGADAVHPGYGFLAENADFAAAVERAGLAFVGPRASAIELMGEKVAAREAAQRARVPLVPGSGAVTSPEQLWQFGDEFGYPVAIKASFGGGGRGMRVVQGRDEARSALESAQREALAAFGHDDVYLERYLTHARHVEVQLMADQFGTVLALADRDCSVQRRNQKLVEEAPAPGLSASLRTQMAQAATRLARAVDYVGAGTIELLVDPEAEAFYFLEMNTRIQVEHTVTEEVLGLDLVAMQLQVASGERLDPADGEREPRGHAIEVRLNAEDVAEGAFRPSPGRIGRFDVPVRAGVRLDTGFRAGDEVPPYYDSLIAKLVVWAPTREHAIERAIQTLDETVITGVPTTIPAARLVLDHTDFRAGEISTRWLEHRLDLATLLPGSDPAEQADHLADGSGKVPDGSGAEPGRAEADVHGVDDGGRGEAWVGGRLYAIPYFGPSAHPEDRPVTPTATPVSRRTRRPATSGDRTVQHRSADARRSRAGVALDGAVTSPMQGTVVSVSVVDGAQVKRGDVLMVLEAMKMENPIRATRAGIVIEVVVAVGNVVAAGEPLARIEAAGDA